MKSVISRLWMMDLFQHYEVEVANIPCDSKMDVDSEQEAGDDMGYDPFDIYWIRGDDEVDLTDEEFSDDMDEVAEVFRIDTNLFDFETPMCKAFKEFNWREDSYCNGGNLPDAYHIRNSLHYQDLEWYEDDDESRYEQKRRWNIYTNYDDAYEINHEDNEREELCEVHELPTTASLIEGLVALFSVASLTVLYIFFYFPSLCFGQYSGDTYHVRGLHAKTSKVDFNTLTYGFYPTIDRLPPIIMVCSGHSGLIATFTFSTGSGVGTSAWRTIWISNNLALSVMIVATPALVRNFIIPCAVDGTTPSARIPGLPRILMRKVSYMYNNISIENYQTTLEDKGRKENSHNYI
ncbi:hypothetical protein Tco_0024309 [Tanacetum coccineum]